VGVPPGQPEKPTITYRAFPQQNCFTKVDVRLSVLGVGVDRIAWQLACDLDALVSKFLLPSFGFGFIGD
jgi:hypothetical protein